MTRFLPHVRLLHRMWLCLGAAVAGASLAWAVDVDHAVLQAQRSRIDAVRRGTAAAVSIFAGDAGGGSGVLLTRDGYAATNFHVVQPAGRGDDVRARRRPTLRRRARGTRSDRRPRPDQASGPRRFPLAEMADSDLVEVGDFCFAAGNPFLLATDLLPSISAGIVSGVHRYQFPAGTILEYTDCLQVDAAINPGNSGGGLFDAEGRLIGVNGRASFEKRGRVNVGVGYAISANQLRNFLGLPRAGTARRPCHARRHGGDECRRPRRRVRHPRVIRRLAARTAVRRRDRVARGPARAHGQRASRTCSARCRRDGRCRWSFAAEAAARRCSCGSPAVHSAAELAALVDGRGPTVVGSRSRRARSRSAAALPAAGTRPLRGPARVRQPSLQRRGARPGGQGARARRCRRADGGRGCSPAGSPRGPISHRTRPTRWRRSTCRPARRASPPPTICPPARAPRAAAACSRRCSSGDGSLTAGPAPLGRTIYWGTRRGPGDARRPIRDRRTRRRARDRRRRRRGPVRRRRRRDAWSASTSGRRPTPTHARCGFEWPPGSGQAPRSHAGADDVGCGGQPFGTFVIDPPAGARGATP